jgi:hypothetical protein
MAPSSTAMPTSSPIRAFAKRNQAIDIGTPVLVALDENPVTFGDEQAGAEWLLCG